MMIKRIQVAIAAAFVAAGAATALAAPAVADDELDEMDHLYLQALDENGIHVGSEEQAIDLAQSMCAVMFRGGEPTDAVIHVKEETGMSDKDSTTFAGIAARVYCEDMLPK